MATIKQASWIENHIGREARDEGRLIERIENVRGTNVNRTLQDFGNFAMTLDTKLASEIISQWMTADRQEQKVLIYNQLKHLGAPIV